MSSDISPRRRMRRPRGETLDGVRLRVLGLPVDRLTMAQTLERIATYIEHGRRDGGVAGVATKATRQVVTLNPEMVMAARSDAELRAAITSADLVVPDGVGVVWASRLLGASLPERVPGVDLLEALAGIASARGYRLFLLGAALGVADEVADQLRARHPSLAVAGTLSGSPAEAEAGAILTAIRVARPDVLCVAFGSPAQERWIAAHRAQLGALVAVGVGGALDFLAGRVPRAPRWMRQMGLEWLYRLWCQPWRWRRMLALPRFALAVLGAATARSVQRGRSRQ